MGKEKNYEDVPLLKSQPIHPCTGNENGMRTVGSNANTHLLHPYENEKNLKARIVRSKRHTARQVCSHLKALFASVPTPTPPSSSVRSRRTSRSRSSSKSKKSNEEDIHTIYTPDNNVVSFTIDVSMCNTCSSCHSCSSFILFGNRS